MVVMLMNKCDHVNYLIGLFQQPQMTSAHWNHCMLWSSGEAIAFFISPLYLRSFQQIATLHGTAIKTSRNYLVVMNQGMFPSRFSQNWWKKCNQVIVQYLPPKLWMSVYDSWMCVHIMPILAARLSSEMVCELIFCIPELLRFLWMKKIYLWRSENLLFFFLIRKW